MNFWNFCYLFQSWLLRPLTPWLATIEIQFPLLPPAFVLLALLIFNIVILMVSSFIIVSVLLFVFKISNVAIEGQEPRSIIILPTAFLLIIFFLILLRVFVIIAILIFLPDPIWTWTWFFGVRLKVYTWRSKSKTAEQNQWHQQQECQ